MRTFSDLIEQAPGSRIIDPGDRSSTVPPLDARVGSLQAWIRPRRGERVGLLLPNVPAFPSVFHALVGAGASAVLLNPLSTRREIAEALEDAGAERLVTLEALRSRCPAVDLLTLEAYGASPPRDRMQLTADERPAPDDEAAVVYTAAMEGWARGARLSHRNLLANARATVEAMELTGADVVVAVLPWIHLFGLTVTLNAPLLAGASILPVTRFHPTRTLEAASAAGGTVLVGVPAIYKAICDAAENAPLADHSFRLAICGGAVLANETARRFEEIFGIPLRQGYGLTEGGPVCLFNRCSEPNRLGTLGRPFPGVDASVRGGGGEVLQPGEVGELCVRGDNVFMGYVGADGRDPAHFHEEWLRTGDLASRDEEGVFRFRGMLKSMFTRSGFNVYPREISRALEADERISRAVLYAAPDAARESELVLDVVPAAGHELDEAAVRDICQARLAAYKQPGRIRITTET